MTNRGKDTGIPAENRDALLWLKKLAGQAAQNRRESGLDATQQIEDVLAIPTGAAPERRSAGRDLPPADTPWFRWACIAFIAAVVVVIAGGTVAAYSFMHLLREEHASFAAQLQEQRQEFLRIRQDFLRDAEPAIY